MLAFVAVFTVFITTDLNKRQAATQKEHDFKQRNLAIIEDWANLVYEATNKIKFEETIRKGLVNEFLKLERLRINSLEMFTLRNFFDKDEDFANKE